MDGSDCKFSAKKFHREGELQRKGEMKSNPATLR
jgi:hypothetical protein